MMRSLTVSGVLTLGLLLGACESTDDSKPSREQLLSEASSKAEAPATVTETVTVEPSAKEVDEPITVDDDKLGEAVVKAYENDFNDEEIGKLALDLTWDAMSPTDRTDICDMWSLDVRDLEETLLDFFFEGMSDPIVTREYARSFFDGKCG